MKGSMSTDLGIITVDLDVIAKYAGSVAVECFGIVGMAMVNVKDGYALQLAMKMGYIIAIISGARTEAVKVRFHGLGIADVYTGVSIKLPCLEKWLLKHNLSPDEVAFVGDDIPDIEVMRRVGLPIAPADAAPEVKDVAKYISPIAGGYGCGRDVIEQIMKAQGKWLADSRAFGW